MKITIKADNDSADDPIDLTITDEGLDNSNFIALEIRDQEWIINIDDLISALKAFDEIRARNKNL